jgi:hypothetical protein
MKSKQENMMNSNFGYFCPISHFGLDISRYYEQ